MNVISGEYSRIGQMCDDMHAKRCGCAPMHRPIDVQTTDGGPGLVTSVKLVRLRMVESFILNDLDLQCRMHYAPM